MLNFQILKKHNNFLLSVAFYLNLSVYSPKHLLFQTCKHKQRK